ncbi:MAG: PAS domain-containing protein [Armatimonadetes bacterium]|nr:PAS domain-containing protein [Armatimonadota bacterium]MBS1710339.1 PAS domain-containing protein [Armatimonadota bacterium]MBX3109024.1 PAS domain-containing protein [Fimbriimonadaceae bacterium]
MAGRGEELLHLAALGLTDKDIADRLCISVRTVEGHWRRLREQTGIPNRAGLVADAFRKQASAAKAEMAEHNGRLADQVAQLQGETARLRDSHAQLEGEARIRSARLQQEINELYTKVNQLKSQSAQQAELNAIVLKGSVLAFKVEAEAPFRCLFISDSVRAFGYRPTEFTDGEIPVTTLFHPEDFESAWAAALDQIQSGTHRMDRRYRLITKRGEERLVLDRCIYEEAAEGSPATLSVFAFDITHTEYADLSPSGIRLA